MQMACSGVLIAGLLSITYNEVLKVDSLTWRGDHEIVSLLEQLYFNNLTVRTKATGTIAIAMVSVIIPLQLILSILNVLKVNLEKLSSIIMIVVSNQNMQL